MTTSIALVMHGDLRAAWTANWAGVVVAVAGAGLAVWLLAVAVGMPTGPFPVEATVRWFTVAAAATVAVRWLSLVSAWL